MTWIVIIMLLVLLLILGDSNSYTTTIITPEILNKRSYESWPLWNFIEYDNRIRVLWIDKTYVPFVNAGNEVCTHQFNKFLLQKPYRWEVYVAVPNLPKRVYENVRCFDLNDYDTFVRVLERTNILCSHNVGWRRSLQTLSFKTGIPFVGWNHTIEYVETHKKQWTPTKLRDLQFTVHNSESIQSGLDDKQNSIVLFPPVNFREYITERKDAKYVTLINVNENKGGLILIEIAKACPEIQFQGVIGGYDKQMKAKLPNLRYLPHTDKIKDVYRDTKILIMPSRIETWGRTAVEAMSSGIPVVASPTPGLQECCGDAAIFIDRYNIEEWVSTIRKLTNDREFYNRQSFKSAERSRALDPEPGLERCREWMENTVIKVQKPGHLPELLEKNLLFL